MYGIPLEYLLRRNKEGNYDAVWNSREDKLNNCVIFVETRSKYDAESLYTLLVQHVDTSGPVSSIIVKHKNFTMEGDATWT